MRSLVRLAVVPVVLGALALVLSLAPRADAAAASPADVTGSYAGKLSYKFYPLVEGDSPEHGSLPATADFTMNATMIGVVLTVETPEGAEVYNLQGRYGLGRFWAAGNGPSGQMSIQGTARGAPGSLKIAGAGSIVSADTLNTFKVNLKQQAPIL